MTEMNIYFHVMNEISVILNKRTREIVLISNFVDQKPVQLAQGEPINKDMISTTIVFPLRRIAEDTICGSLKKNRGGKYMSKYSTLDRFLKTDVNNGKIIMDDNNILSIGNI